MVSNSLGGKFSLITGGGGNIAVLGGDDGVIVGSDLKVDGGTWNPVEPERARRFMAEVRAARES